MRTRLLHSGVLVLLAASLLAGGIVRAFNSQEDIWYVLSGGGGRVESDDMILDSSMGLPFAGEVRADEGELCLGFWCGAADAATPTVTATATRTRTATASATRTSTRTATATRTRSQTPTTTLTATPPATNTGTPTATQGRWRAVLPVIIKE